MAEIDRPKPNVYRELPQRRLSVLRLALFIVVMICLIIPPLTTLLAWALAILIFILVIGTLARICVEWLFPVS